MSILLCCCGQCQMLVQYRLTHTAVSPNVQSENIEVLYQSNRCRWRTVTDLVNHFDLEFNSATGVWNGDIPGYYSLIQITGTAVQRIAGTPTGNEYPFTRYLWSAGQIGCRDYVAYIANVLQSDEANFDGVNEWNGTIAIDPTSLPGCVAGPFYDVEFTATGTAAGWAGVTGTATPPVACAGFDYTFEDITGVQLCSFNCDDSTAIEIDGQEGTCIGFTGSQSVCEGTAALSIAAEVLSPDTGVSPYACCCFTCCVSCCYEGSTITITLSYTGEVVGEEQGTTTGGTTVGGTTLVVPIEPDTFTVTLILSGFGPVIFSDDGQGFFTSTPTVPFEGSINYETGEWSITLQAGGTFDAQTYYADYEINQTGAVYEFEANPNCPYCLGDGEFCTLSEPFHDIVLDYASASGCIGVVGITLDIGQIEEYNGGASLMSNPELFNCSNMDQLCTWEGDGPTATVGPFDLTESGAPTLHATLIIQWDGCYRCMDRHELTRVWVWQQDEHGNILSCQLCIEPECPICELDEITSYCVRLPDPQVVPPGDLYDPNWNQVGVLLPIDVPDLCDELITPLPGFVVMAALQTLVSWQPANQQNTEPCNKCDCEPSTETPTKPTECCPPCDATPFYYTRHVRTATITICVNAGGTRVNCILVGGWSAGTSTGVGPGCGSFDTSQWRLTAPAPTVGGVGPPNCPALFTQYTWTVTAVRYTQQDQCTNNTSPWPSPATMPSAPSVSSCWCSGLNTTGESDLLCN